MAFIVEDGTGVADSNSYGAVADANSYFTDRGDADWTGTDAEKEQALVQATDYIDVMNGHRFIGDKVDEDQSLEFPRDYWGAVIPRNLERATFEYAKRALSGALAPDPTVDATGYAVKRVKSVVGPISDETEYMDQGAGSTQSLLKPYPAADALLVPLLRSTAKVIRG